jgi:hypothetical protein
MTFRSPLIVRRSGERTALTSINYYVISAQDKPQGMPFAQHDWPLPRTAVQLNRSWAFCYVSHAPSVGPPTRNGATGISLSQTWHG